MNGLKIVTIGGGSSYTPELVEGFIKRADVLPVRELWLVDIEEGKEKLEIVGALAKRMVEKAGLDMRVHLTLDRREALKDADFVTTQMRVGLLAAREKDERIPLTHGVLGQETNGAGGMFKALRTIPVILDIAKDIEELCPNAWMINFTNPAGMVTEALIRYSNLTKVIGLCNVPIGIERLAAKLFDVSPDRVRILFGGLNHMVYGLKVFVDGELCTDKLINLMLEANSSAVANVMSIPYEKSFLRQLGVIPCPYHNYYYKLDAMLKHELEELEKGNIRAQAVQKLETDLFEIYKDENLNIKPPQLEKRGGAHYSEAACRLIESIYTDKKDIQPVDVRNNGAIDGIDFDSAVEVSCVITKDGPMPINIGKLPVAINGLVMQIKSFERLVVEAAAESNYDKAVLALGINPLTPSDIKAREIVDDLLEAHKPYLNKKFFERG